MTATPPVAWPGRSIVQVAYVVDDIVASMHRWTNVFGVGPWMHNPDIRVTAPRYRGRPTDLRFAGAVTHSGGVQLELIQQLDDSPSCYRDLFPRGREGQHHVAVFAGDFDADVARYVDEGFPVAFEGTHRDMRFAYVDASPALGVMIEILEDVASIREAFAGIEAASRAWDGTEPIRSRTTGGAPTP